jgi:putative PIN family toxin of toxin-antitoxin system
MRVVLDTNVLVSALMIQTGNPAAIYRAWQEGRFILLTCAEQFDELRATLRKPAIAGRIKPYKAGGLVNEMKELAESVDALPRVRRSPDPTDDFLLALSEAGGADYLVTGDKSGLLALEHHKGTRIVSAPRIRRVVLEPPGGLLCMRAGPSGPETSCRRTVGRVNFLGSDGRFSLKIAH